MNGVGENKVRRDKVLCGCLQNQSLNRAFATEQTVINVFAVCDANITLY